MADKGQDRPVEARVDGLELADEVKAKLRGCETTEEILALAKEEGYELSDDELDGVSGGWGSCGHVGECLTVLPKHE